MMTTIYTWCIPDVYCIRVCVRGMVCVVWCAGGRMYLLHAYFSSCLQPSICKNSNKKTKHCNIINIHKQKVKENVSSPLGHVYPIPIAASVASTSTSGSVGAWQKNRKISKVQNKAIASIETLGLPNFWDMANDQWWSMSLCVFKISCKISHFGVSLWAFVIFPPLAMICFSCSNSAHLFIRFRIWRCLAKDLASSTGERVTNPSKIGNGWQVQAICLYYKFL